VRWPNANEIQSGFEPNPEWIVYQFVPNVKQNNPSPCHTSILKGVREYRQLQVGDLCWQHYFWVPQYRQTLKPTALQMGALEIPSTLPGCSSPE
jgi:hypothetical protein